MLLDLGDLRVRSWRKNDLDALVRYANNPKIAANLRDQFPHPYTQAAAANKDGETGHGDWQRFSGPVSPSLYAGGRGELSDGRARGGGRDFLRGGVWRRSHRRRR